jgi:nucleoside-triphosphatase
LNNLLITGPPRCGKTTLIKKTSIHPDFSGEVGGFITEEIREKGDRVGFQIISYPEGKRGVLARKGMPSLYHLGSYGVNLYDLESIGCAAIEKALSSGHIIIVDEIGKMELFSKKFRGILAQALDSPQKVLATIMERRNEFTDRIKTRKDVTILKVNRINFETSYQDVLKWMHNK